MKRPALLKALFGGVAMLVATAWLYAGYWISETLLRPPRMRSLSPDGRAAAQLPFAYTWPTTHPMVVTGPWPAQSDPESMGPVQIGDTILAIEGVPVSWRSWVAQRMELESRQAGDTVSLEIKRVHESGVEQFLLASVQLIGQTRSPADLGMAFNPLRLALSSGLHVEGWHIPSGDPPAPTIIALHGHASSRHSMLDGLAPALHRAGYNLLLMDATGHGSSEGVGADLVGIDQVERVIAWLQQQAKSPVVDVALIGHSFGGVTAARAASIRDVRGLVLLAAPLSVRQGVEAFGSRFMHVPGWLISSVFPSLAFWIRVRSHHSMYEVQTLRALERLQRPLFVVQGSQDELWQYDTAIKLYDAAHSPKKLLILCGHDHNSVLVAGDQLLEPLLVFLSEAFDQP